MKVNPRIISNFRVIRTGIDKIKVLAGKCISATAGIIDIEESEEMTVEDGDSVWIKEVWTIVAEYRQLPTYNVPGVAFSRLLTYRYTEPTFTYVVNADEAIENFTSSTTYTKIADISIDEDTEILTITQRKTSSIFIPRFEKAISTGLAD